jgi:CIC family chloride channel protein
MLGTLVSKVVAQRLNAESVYTEALARRGIHLRQGRDVNVMEQLRVQEVMRENWIVVEGDLPLPKLGEYFQEHAVNALPVVDDRGELAGMVTLQAYQNALPSEQHSAMQVTDIAMQNVPTIYADQTLNDAMSLFGVSDVSLLPVVSRQNRQEIVGLVERSDIVDAYRRALVRREEFERWVQASQLDGESEGSTLSLVLPDRGGAVGWSLRDLELGRYQAVVVRIQRGVHPAQRAGIMPRGDTVLQGSDQLTIALGDPQSASTIRETLIDGVGLDPTQRTDRIRITIASDTPWPSGRRVRELSIKGGILLVRVRRGGQVIIPHGDTILYPGDVVEAVGKEGDLAAFKAYLGST